MNTLVFDLGKTHIKVHLLDKGCRTLSVAETRNRPLTDARYPAADVDGIFHWLLENLKVMQAEFGIHRISITTHGATAALIDAGQGGNGLVLPVPDYEYAGFESLNSEYDAIRPDFSETGSPDLPDGLNLGRQLYWLWRTYPEEFNRCSHILLYPQYWVWRLTGSLVSEVTSLGCHTDLWAPWRQSWSSLMEKQGWREKFPPLASAWEVAGTVREDIRSVTGIAGECTVYVGVHDSNASYLRYKRALGKTPFTVLSTGTWSIAMNGRADQFRLREERDMLANVDVTGQPVICSRFMGGREYQRICEALGGGLDSTADEAGIDALIAAGVLCLPPWQPGTGPFGGNRAEIRGEIPPGVEPAALAGLYCALMLDYQLELVASEETIILGGAFLKNPLLCGLLAQLRDSQPLLASQDITGTVVGAAQLADWDAPPEKLQLDRIRPTTVTGLGEYRERWKNTCENFLITDN